MNKESLNLMRGLFTVAASAFERAESTASESSMRFNQETANRLFPQAAAVAAVVQAEALVSIAESLATIVAEMESTSEQAINAAIWKIG